MYQTTGSPSPHAQNAASVPDEPDDEELDDEELDDEELDDAPELPELPELPDDPDDPVDASSPSASVLPAPGSPA